MSDAAKSRPDLGDTARKWWRSLQDEDAQGHAKAGNRAALARLRRASAAGAMTEAATLDLFAALGYGSHESRRLPRVATLAVLLAHVRENVHEPFGRAIGRTTLSEADSALLKPMRFKALAAADGEEEILRAFRRAVDLLGGKADVADLARIVLLFERDETRRDLAFSYFGAAAARPSESESRP